MTAHAVGPEQSASLPSAARAERSGWGRWAGGLYAIWLREVKRAVRDRGQLIGGVVPPAALGADHGHRPQSVFPRRDLRRGALRRALHLSAVHLPGGDRAQHHVHLGAVGGVRRSGTASSASCARCWSRRCRAPTILLGKILGGTTVALFHGALVLALARFADLSLSLADIACGLALDVPARLCADLARRRHRQPHPQLRGLRGVLQRRDPAALFHFELDLSARSVADQRADPRDLSGMAGDRWSSSIRSPMRSMRCAAPSSISISSIRGSDRSSSWRWRPCSS